MIKFILKYGEKVTRLQIFYFSPSKQFSKNSIVKNYYCSNCLLLSFIKIPRFVGIIYFSFICASNLPKFSTLWLKLNSILLFFSSVYNFPLYNKRSRNAACYLNKFQLEKLRKPRKIIANNERNEWKYRLNHTLSREQKKRSFDFRKCIIDPLQLFLSSSQHGESIWNGNRGGEGEGWMERRSSVPSVHYLNSSAPYSVSIPIIESEWNRFDTLASRAFPPSSYLISFYLCIRA